MTRLATKMGLVVLAVALVALASSSAVFAGDYHTGAGLRCSDCHIMHASKDGVLFNGGDGNGGLLKSATSNGLCLTCHDGTDTTAPDVIAGGTATSPQDSLAITYASKYLNSGGFFQTDATTTASGLAHNLGGGPVTAIQGGWASSSTGMKCTDCHDAHGGTNYRNLTANPGGVGPVAVTAATSGTADVILKEAITIPATNGTTATHYDTDAVGFNTATDIVTWCTGCHTNIATGNKHKQDVAVTGAKVDSAHWIAGTGLGFGTDIDAAAGTEGIPRVRFAQTGSTYTDTHDNIAATNKVFCLTCHKAHGSKYDSGLVWPYYTSNAADRTSACNQCHSKGF